MGLSRLAVALAEMLRGNFQGPEVGDECGDGPVVKRWDESRPSPAGSSTAAPTGLSLTEEALAYPTGQASSTAPAPISSTASHWRVPSCSPSTTTPSNATSTTLSLSIGPTRDTGPSCKARK